MGGIPRRIFSITSYFLHEHVSSRNKVLEVKTLRVILFAHEFYATIFFTQPHREHSFFFIILESLALNCPTFYAEVSGILTDFHP